MRERFGSRGLRGHNDSGWSQKPSIQTISRLGDVHDGVSGHTHVLMRNRSDSFVPYRIERPPFSLDPLNSFLPQKLLERTVGHLYAFAKSSIAIFLGPERPLQIVRDHQELPQQACPVRLDALLGQASLPLSEVLDLGLEAQSSIAPHLKIFLKRLDFLR